MSKKKKLWSRSIGVPGNRVRIYEPRAGAPLMRSVYINGAEDRRSLGHRDRERAEREAIALLAQLAADEMAVADRSVTLGQLLRLYKDSPAFADKKERTQKEDARRLERVVAFLGSGRDVRTLREADCRLFVRARRAGDPTLIGVRPGVPVRARSLEADLVALQTMLNWAARERHANGKRILDENPLRGVSIPREKNPIRPVVTYPEYLALLSVAPEVHPLLPIALRLAEGTGRRLSAIRQLRWSDVDLSAQTINWRAENDKKGYASIAPISDDLREALKEEQRRQGATGDMPIFPAPKNPAVSCRVEILDGWLRKAYERAGLTPQKGGLWHPFRRKWATERKGRSPVDVARAGGWKNPHTPLRIYQQADIDTMRLVVSEPTFRLGA